MLGILVLGPTMHLRNQLMAAGENTRTMASMIIMAANMLTPIRQHSLQRKIEFSIFSSGDIFKISLVVKKPFLSLANFSAIWLSFKLDMGS